MSGYERDGPSTTVIIFSWLFLLAFFSLMIYAIFCSFNMYYIKVDYMNTQTCQQKEMNETLKEISNTLKCMNVEN